MEARGYAGADTYRPGNAWFICDRCGQRHRRSGMLTEWTGLKVDSRCLDPRPPQMQPPNVYPEGQPFWDARPPQDRPDRLQDDTTLQSVTGGVLAPYGELHPDGQNQLPGALSPLQLVENPTPLGPDVLADDITFVTGVVQSSFVDTSLSIPQPITNPSVTGTAVVGGTLTGHLGTWSGDP